MLTPDDGGSDGRLTRYLNNPAAWQQYDPDLFGALAEVVSHFRSVRAAGTHAILADAIFADEFVPDAIEDRKDAFARVKQALAPTDLVFLDPDNGVEVQSCRVGRRGSSKYVLRSEIIELYQAGHSVIVYQHFPREERGSFISRIGTTLFRATGAPSLTCFRTSNVGFFLLPQPSHEVALSRGADQVTDTWKSQIAVMRDCHL